LTFTRRQPAILEVVDINDIIFDVQKMLKRVLMEKIEIRVSTAVIPRVRADRGQIEQVILNLAVNARDAMPDGGVLSISTSVVQFDEECARRREVAPGQYVALVLTDSGCGMTAETVAHAFDAFFTTKGVGKGTGLGLATVNGIMKSFAGCVNIDSTPSVGTTVSAFFPVYVPTA
jgi:signal transduction histidine kinase